MLWTPSLPILPSVEPGHLGWNVEHLMMMSNAGKALKGFYHIYIDIIRLYNLLQNCKIVVENTKSTAVSFRETLSFNVSSFAAPQRNDGVKDFHIFPIGFFVKTFPCNFHCNLLPMLVSHKSIHNWDEFHNHSSPKSWLVNLSPPNVTPSEIRV